MPRTLPTKIITIAMTLMLASLLAACGADDNPTVTISGDLQIADQASIPADSTARVSVFEHRDSGGDKRIVAERTLHELDKKPIPFELDIARNLINPQGEYGLRAEIMAGEGEVLWHSPKPTRFKPLEQGEAMRLKLEPVAQEMETTFEKYRCADGFHLSAATDDEQAVVRLGNRRLVLAVEADGQTYTDEHDNQLVVTEAGIDFRVDDADHQSCIAVQDQAPPTATTTAQASSDEPANGTGEAEGDTQTQLGDESESNDKPATAEPEQQAPTPES